MPRYECQNCGRTINSEWELTVTPNLVCYQCYIEKNGDKEKTKRHLVQKYGYKCIVPGCPYKVKNSGNGLHVHRILKGRDGGKYELDNCVFVFRHHHKTIEGKTLQEILAMRCTPEQIARMDVYNVAESLLDYEWQVVEEKIIEMCDDLGVPATCSKYDIVKAIKGELRLANTACTGLAVRSAKKAKSTPKVLSVKSVGTPASQ